MSAEESSGLRTPLQSCKQPHEDVESSPAQGVSLGIFLKQYSPLPQVVVALIGYPGDLLMWMLQAVTVPLIVTSVVTGISGLSSKSSKRIAVYSGIYMVLSTFIAVIIGIILAMLIKPGSTLTTATGESKEEENFSIAIVLMDLIRPSLGLPPAGMLFQHIDEEMVGKYVKGTNIPGLIFTSILVGLILNKNGEKGKALVDLIVAANEVIKCVVSWILGYLPFGILFMIASHVVEVHDWESTVKLVKLLSVVLLGQGIFSIGVLPLIYFLCARRNPLIIFRGISAAIVTALLVSSSAAALPVTFSCCENKLKIDKRVSRFMLSIATSISMTGTALYEVVAVIFIAQLNYIDLDASQLFTIAISAAVSSIGATGIPATGSVTTLFVLTAVGIPAKEVSMLVVIEWMLDRTNTAVNVLGDCFGVAIVYELVKKELMHQDIAIISEDQIVVDLPMIHAHAVGVGCSPDDLQDDHSFHTPPEEPSPQKQ
ncbi:excitatory amino acid transporter 3-like [Embiotoca jacksoni]|uniref:excitatory amino acid transporter 3-like n=1 Tax=Embiotoca jacksoni TaxID=100190 RepID=UPI0037037032